MVCCALHRAWLRLSTVAHGTEPSHCLSSCFTDTVVRLSFAALQSRPCGAGRFFSARAASAEGMPRHHDPLRPPAKNVSASEGWRSEKRLAGNWSQVNTDI